MKIKFKYNAPVILTFAIISGVVLLLSELTGQRALAWFATGRGPILSIRTWVTMFTYVLGHASFEHYLSNMMLFLLLGPGIEEKYGSKDTILIIVITAVITALFNMLLSSSYLTGASGVVFAFIILSSMTSYSKGEIPLTLVVILILYLGQEVYNGLLMQDNISQLGHIVGGACGAAYGFLYKNA